MAEKSVTLFLENTNEVSRNLKLVGERAIAEAAKALHQEHEMIITEAKKRTPVDTGALRSSGHVKPPVFGAHTVVSEGGFGGAAAPYAILVHENLKSHHNPPTRAKFYESALLDSIPDMDRRLAAKIRALT